MPGTLLLDMGSFGHAMQCASKMGRVEGRVAEQVVRAWRMDVASAEMHLLDCLGRDGEAPCR